MDPPPRSPHFPFSLVANCFEFPCIVATVIVNSEPHTGTGARPSVCVCAWGAN
jgi:hypothetical protein